MAVAKQGTTLAVQQLFKTKATLELFHSQREAAHYLQLSYLQLSDHPDVASEVRMTAHSARSQHLLTIGLMKKFQATASHILSIMIPMLFDAVELRDKDIIVEVFAKIIANAESMKTEAEKTQTSYANILTNVQKTMGSLGMKIKKVNDKGTSIENKIEEEKKREHEEKLALEELEEEKKEFQENIKMLKEQQAESFKLFQEAGRKLTEDEKKDEKQQSPTFLDQLRPTAAMGGVNVISQGIEVADKAINLFTNIHDTYTKANTHKQLRKGYEAADDKLHRAQQEKLVLVERMNKKRHEAISRLAKMKVLCQQKVSLGNVESLREASGHLGNVDRQLSRIILFWGEMAVVLKYLKDDVNAGDVYLKQIEKPEYAERFKQSIGRGEQGWTKFGAYCSDYVVASETSIQTLYDFLSAPIDSMSAAQIQQRKDGVIMAIDSDIKSTYGDGK